MGNMRKYSREQEERVAKLLGGRVVANSGATPFNKGDVMTKCFLIECKTKATESDSITIKKDWILKHTDEKFFMGKSASALAISFADYNDYFVIDKELMRFLVDKWEEEYENATTSE